MYLPDWIARSVAATHLLALPTGWCVSYCLLVFMSYDRGKSVDSIFPKSTSTIVDINKIIWNTQAPEVIACEENPNATYDARVCQLTIPISDRL